MDRKQRILNELIIISYKQRINEPKSNSIRRQELIKELSDISIKQAKLAEKAKVAEISVPELLTKLRMKRVPSKLEIDEELECLHEDCELCQDMTAMHRSKLLRQLRKLL